MQTNPQLELLLIHELIVLAMTWSQGFYPCARRAKNAVNEAPMLVFLGNCLVPSISNKCTVRHCSLVLKWDFDRFLQWIFTYKMGPDFVERTLFPPLSNACILLWLLLLFPLSQDWILPDLCFCYSKAKSETPFFLQLWRGIQVSRG